MGEYESLHARGQEVGHSSIPSVAATRLRSPLEEPCFLEKSRMTRREVLPRMLMIGLVLGTVPTRAADSGPASLAKASREAEPLALTISGGVSLGAYEAGLSWALVQYLKTSRAMALKDPELRHPELVAASGASAGSINSLLAALTWCASPNSKETIDDNLFLSTWQQVGFDALLPPRQDNEPAAEAYDPWDSLLTSRAFNGAIQSIEQRLKGPGGFSPGCVLPLGITITRAVPESIEVAGLRTKVQRFNVPWKLEVDAEGNLAIRNHFLPGPTSSLDTTAYLTEELGVSPEWEASRPSVVQPKTVIAAIKASSAVPFAFGPIRLTYCATRCTSEGSRRSSPASPETDAACLPIAEELRRLRSIPPDRGLRVCTQDFFDGGVFDNTPLGAALAQAETFLETREPGTQVTPIRPLTYLFVDPDFRRLPAAPDEAARPERGNTQRLGGVPDFEKQLAFIGHAIDTARNFELHAAIQDRDLNLTLLQHARRVSQGLDSLAWGLTGGANWNEPRFSDPQQPHGSARRAFGLLLASCMEEVPSKNRRLEDCLKQLEEAARAPANAAPPGDRPPFSQLQRMASGLQAWLGETVHFCRPVEGKSATPLSELAPRLAFASHAYTFLTEDLNRTDYAQATPQELRALRTHLLGATRGLVDMHRCLQSRMPQERCQALEAQRGQLEFARKEAEAGLRMLQQDTSPLRTTLELTQPSSLEPDEAALQNSWKSVATAKKWLEHAEKSAQLALQFDLKACLAAPEERFLADLDTMQRVAAVPSLRFQSLPVVPLGVPGGASQPPASLSACLEDAAPAAGSLESSAQVAIRQQMKKLSTSAPVDLRLDRCQAQRLEEGLRKAQSLQAMAQDIDGIADSLEPLLAWAAKLESGKRDRSVILSSRFSPLASSQLRNFGAFLDAPLRQTDYYIGVYEAAHQLAQHFCAERDPYDHQTWRDMNELAPQALSRLGTTDMQRCLGAKLKDIASVLGISQSRRASHVFRHLAQLEVKASLNDDALANELLRTQWRWLQDLPPPIHTGKDAAPAKEGGKSDIPPATEQERAIAHVLDVLTSRKVACQHSASDAKVCLADVSLSELSKGLASRGYAPQSEAMRRFLTDSTRWGLETAIRAASRASVIQRDTEFEEDLSPGLNVMRLVLTRQEGLHRSFQWDSSSIPSSAPPGTSEATPVAFHLLPYRISVDVMNRGLLLSWFEPVWRPTRWLNTHLGINPIELQWDRDWNTTFSSSLTPSFSFRVSPNFSVGLGPSAQARWRRHQWLWGGELYADFLQERLRVGGGLRDGRASEATGYLYLGLADFNGTLFWMMR
jgi:hypothetical protein